MPLLFLGALKISLTSSILRDWEMANCFFEQLQHFFNFVTHFYIGAYPHTLNKFALFRNKRRLCELFCNIVYCQKYLSDITLVGYLIKYLGPKDKGFFFILCTRKYV